MINLKASTFISRGLFYVLPHGPGAPYVSVQRRPFPRIRMTDNMINHIVRHSLVVSLISQTMSSLIIQAKRFPLVPLPDDRNHKF